MKRRHWLVHFPDREPVPRKYQEPVGVDRVLGEHHGAVAAEPLQGARTSASVGDSKRTNDQTGESRCN